MRNKTIEDVLSSELARHAPELSAAEISAHTAAAVALGAYRLQDNKLVPGAPEAVRQASFLPKALTRAIAQSMADAESSPAAKTAAYVRALGAASFEAALGLDDGARIATELADAVRAETDAQAATWERTAAILGVPVDRR